MSCETELNTWVAWDHYPVAPGPLPYLVIDYPDTEIAQLIELITGFTTIGA